MHNPPHVGVTASAASLLSGRCTGRASNMITSRQLLDTIIQGQVGIMAMTEVGNVRNLVDTYASVGSVPYLPVPSWLVNTYQGL